MKDAARVHQPAELHAPLQAPRRARVWPRDWRALSRMLNGWTVGDLAEYDRGVEHLVADGMDPDQAADRSFAELEARRRDAEKLEPPSPEHGG